MLHDVIFSSVCLSVCHIVLLCWIGLLMSLGYESILIKFFSGWALSKEELASLW